MEQCLPGKDDHGTNNMIELKNKNIKFQYQKKLKILKFIKSS